MRVYNDKRGMDLMSDLRERVARACVGMRGVTTAGNAYCENVTLLVVGSTGLSRGSVQIASEDICAPSMRWGL
jgi:hypothetical protein